MSSIYQQLQGVASGLMSEFGQGAVRYIEPGAPSGPDYDPTPGAPTLYDLDATVRGVQAQYVDGQYITSSDLQVTMSVFGAIPNTDGRIEIDGREHQVIRVDPKPAAGTTVVWLVFVKG